MASEFVDLHCHSTASDGTRSPSDVIALAVEVGLSALALTDHDTIGGVAEASAAAQKAGIDFLAAIEISCQYPAPGTLHLLGYGVDPESESLQTLTRKLLAGRDDRNPKIIARLQELGLSITMDEINAEAGGLVIGRPHIAAVLLRKGYVSSIKNAFDKYLAPGGLAYVDKERLSPKRAIELVKESGGLPVLAHPFQLRTENDAQLRRIVKDLFDVGLVGIEVIHSDHDAPHVKRYTELADELGLLKTGGSDYHGRNKDSIQLGTAQGRRIPREYFDDLVSRLESNKVKS